MQANGKAPAAKKQESSDADSSEDEKPQVWSMIYCISLELSSMSHFCCNNLQVKTSALWGYTSIVIYIIMMGKMKYIAIC